MAGSLRRVPAVPLLAVLVVLAAVAAAVLFWLARSAQLRTDDRQALEAAARNQMLLLNAVGPDAGTAWEQQVTTGVTDPLKSQIAPYLSQTRNLAAQGVVAAPAVVEAGVRDQTADRATVDLFVTVTVREGEKDPVTSPYRWSATMKKVDGTWLMSDVQPVAGGA